MKNADGAPGISVNTSGNVSGNIVHLYEGDYERDHVTVTYALRGTPNFWDEKYMADEAVIRSLDGCLVRLQLEYDTALDVMADPG